MDALKEQIVRVALPVPLYQCFDYQVPAATPLKKGMRVLVPFGKRKLVGIITEYAAQLNQSIDLKSIIEVLDNESLFAETVLHLIEWATRYYHYPIGEVYAAALPSLLRQGKKPLLKQKRCEKIFAVDTQALILTDEQQSALAAIEQNLNRAQNFLLQGVTGSGKTEVYLRVIEKIIQGGRQTLLLVPEISLTPQTIQRFKNYFPEIPIGLFHSGLTERERLNTWLRARSGQDQIIIGTRSAIFMSFARLGIIIIDEEHDASFKQQEGFRYSARDLAVVRGQLEQIPIVLGSATPSLESFYNGQRGRYHVLHLAKRSAQASLPQLRLVDLRGKKLQAGLSAELLTAIQSHLDQQGQVLIFLNRRGFAPVWLCQTCGWIADCARCDTKLIYHQSPVALRCHHCGYTRLPERCCPNGHTDSLEPLGLGTQQIEQCLARYFPGVGISRLDRDSTRKKGGLETILHEVHSGRSRILIGTQMLAKGHHFPEITLVAIIHADNGLFSADFRGAERMAQLLLQVAGRAGRAHKAGMVLIQTFQPEHPFFKHLLAQDYQKFAEFILQERQLAGWPPYAYLAALRAEASVAERPLAFLNHIKEAMGSCLNAEIHLLGPVPLIIERKKGKYRAQLLLRAAHRMVLQDFLAKIVAYLTESKQSRLVKWSLDVDPWEVI